jgi:hypothetical protein
MNNGSIVFRFLFPADEHPAEPIHPTVRSFHHPAPRSLAGASARHRRLLSARRDVSDHPQRSQECTHLVKVIPFVQTQVVRAVQRRPWSSHGNAFDRLPHQLEVVDVRSRDGQSHRNAVSFDQQTSLGAGFGSIRGIRAGFFPRPAAISSSPRPCSATTSPDLSVRRTPPTRFATASQTHRPRAIPETVGARSNWNKGPWRSRHSIDTPSAPQRALHPSRLGRCAAADHGAMDPCSHAQATRAPQTPKTRPTRAIDVQVDSSASVHPPFRASMPEKTIDQSPVFGIGSKQSRIC